MIRCMVTRGFFVLSRCGRAAVGPCVQCGRPVCDAHVIGTANGPACPECAAPDPAAVPVHDPRWPVVYRRRHRYGHGHGRRGEQQPTTYDTYYWQSSFDDYDRGAFDPSQREDFGDDDASGGDFGDPDLHDS